MPEDSQLYKLGVCYTQNQTFEIGGAVLEQKYLRHFVFQDKT